MNVIRKMRLDKQMTQTELASKLGVTKTTVWTWERRPVAIKKKNREMLSKVFGEPEQRFLCSSDDISKLVLFVPESFDDKMEFLRQLSEAWGCK